MDEREFYFREDADDRRLAAQLAATSSDPFLAFEARADLIYDWLGKRASVTPAVIKVGDPMVSNQDDNSPVPLIREGAKMAVVMSDTQIVTYPAPEAEDSKGFPVQDTITETEDSNGTVVTLVVNADGSSVLTAVAPGVANVTWTDGTLSFTDAINVTAGAAASIVVGPGVVSG